MGGWLAGSWSSGFRWGLHSCVQSILMHDKRESASLESAPDHVQVGGDVTAGSGVPGEKHEVRPGEGGAHEGGGGVH